MNRYRSHGYWLQRAPADGDAAGRDRARLARRRPTVGNGINPSQPGYPPAFLEGRDQVFADSATAAGLTDKIGCSQSQFSEQPLRALAND
jgi:hypothetical protein